MKWVPGSLLLLLSIAFSFAAGWVIHIEPPPWWGFPAFVWLFVMFGLAFIAAVFKLGKAVGYV